MLSYCILVVSLIVAGNSAYQNCKSDSLPIQAIANVEAGDGCVRGYVEFTQNYESGPVTIDIQLTGLSPGLHAFHIHEFPVSEGDCMTAGAHFNPDKNDHHGKEDYDNRHTGDLGNVRVDEQGRTNVVFEDKLVQLIGERSIIGRSFVIHEKEDDNGLGGDLESTKTGNAGARIGCGTIRTRNEI